MRDPAPAAWAFSASGTPQNAAGPRFLATASGGGAARRGFVASATAAVESFFFEPAQADPAAEGASPVERRPVVCVMGLARGCGVTVVARALAAELAARDSCGAAAVQGGTRPAGIPLATHAATALARLLDDIPRSHPRAVGRLCLVSGEANRVVGTARYHAPVVLDAGSEELGGAPGALADRAVVVTSRDVEPALARVAAECIARVGPPPVVVLNRSPHDPPGLFALPNSPLGARLALGGREAPGELGRAIAELADLLEDPP
jgi:hypothetical protein